MVLLVHKFSLFNNKHTSSKLENHNQSEPLSSFRSHISRSLIRLSRPESEILSLKWIRTCINLLDGVNNAFANLVVALDYPMTKWEASLIDEHLKYTLHFLQLLNSITSSVSQLDQTRIVISHALSIIETSPSAAVTKMSGIRWNHAVGDVKLNGGRNNRMRICSGKELLIHQALMDMESVGLWVCGIVLSGLNSDDSMYDDLRKLENEFAVTLLSAAEYNSSSNIEEKMIIKEVKELKEAVNCVLSEVGSGNGSSSSDAAKELERRLHGIEAELKGIGDEVNSIFSKVMIGRNELLETLRRKNK